MIERLLHDVRYAARSLRRSPAFTIAATLVLALGIGANTAVFSVGRRVLLEPLPYPEPDRLVQLISRTQQTGVSALASVPKLNEWRAGVGPGVFRAVAAYYSSGPGVTLTGGGRQRHLDAMYVTANYFDVFEAPVALGRAFTPAEDVPQGAHVVVISYAFWLKEYGKSRSPVGETISLGNEAYEVVGVLGSAFRSIPVVDVWLPLQAPSVSFNHTNYLTIVGRLRPGVSIETAERQLLNTTRPFRQKFPWTMGPAEEFGVEPLGRMVAGNTQAAIRILAAAVAFVLLIACANVANLFAARASRRHGEIATRAALGASRVRLVRQLFSECILLALFGGLLGLLSGYTGVRALLEASPGGMPPVSVTPDRQVLWFTIAVSAATAMLFGVLPVLTASRVDLSTTMKDSGAQSVTGSGQHRRQAVLVVTELMLAIVLLIGAGLMLKTFATIRSVDRGFDPSNVLTVQLPLNDARFQRATAIDALVRDVERRMATIAGATGVAATYSMPLEPSISIPFTLLERGLGAAAYHGVGNWRSISPQFFNVFHIPLLRGRRFTDLDDANAARVVIINQSMARRFWQFSDPVGERLLIGKSADREFDEPPRTIVGVVADVRDLGANSNPEPMMYVPLAQASDYMIARNNRFLPLTWVVRTNGDPMTFRSQVERELTAASGGLPIARSQSMAAVVRAATAQLEFTTILLSIFAAAALVLAAVGLYGLMSYSVEQRTQEIGIRIALGAGPASVRNMILLQGVRLTIAGVTLGLAAAFTLSRGMSSAVFGIATWDAQVFAVVATLLGSVSLVAMYMPALAATRVDPLRTLRR